MVLSGSSHLLNRNFSDTYVSSSIRKNRASARDYKGKGFLFRLHAMMYPMVPVLKDAAHPNAMLTPKTDSEYALSSSGSISRRCQDELNQSIASAHAEDRSH